MKRPLFVTGMIFLGCTALSATVSRAHGIAAGLILAMLALIFGRGARVRALAYIAALAVLLSWASFSVYDRRLAHAESLSGRSYQYCGYISRIGSSQGSYAVRAVVEGAVREIWLYNEAAAGYAVGDWVSGGLELRGALEAPSGYLLSGGIALRSGSAEIAPSAEPEVFPSGERLLRRIAMLRAEAVSAVAFRVAGDEGEVVTGMLFSDDGGLFEEHTALRSSGAGRYLRVSGFQLAFWLGLICGIEALSRRGRWLRFGVGTAAIFIITAAGGFSPYLLRAAFVQLAVLTGLTIGRRADRLSAIALALILLCCLCPPLAGDAAFWLSVSATIGVAVLFAPLNRLLSALRLFRGRLGRRAAFFGALLLSSQLALMPVYAVVYGRAYPLLFITGVILQPLAMLILPLGALAVGLLMLGAGSAGAWMLSAACLPARVMLAVSEPLDRLPIAVLRLPFVWQWALAAAFSLCFAAAILRQGRSGPRRVFAAAGVLCLTALVVSSLALSERAVLVADDRTGSALVTRGNSTVLLYACQDEYSRALTADMLRLYGGGEMTAVVMPPYSTLAQDASALHIYLPRRLYTSQDHVGVLAPMLPEGCSAAALVCEDAYDGLTLCAPREYMTELALAQTKVLKLWAGYDIIQADDIPTDTDIVIDLRGRAYDAGKAGIHKGITPYSVAVLD